MNMTKISRFWRCRPFAPTTLAIQFETMLSIIIHICTHCTYCTNRYTCTPKNQKNAQIIDINQNCRNRSVSVGAAKRTIYSQLTALVAQTYDGFEFVTSVLFLSDHPIFYTHFVWTTSYSVLLTYTISFINSCTSGHSRKMQSWLFRWSFQLLYSDWHIRIPHICLLTHQNNCDYRLHM